MATETQTHAAPAGQPVQRMSVAQIAEKLRDTINGLNDPLAKLAMAKADKDNANIAAEGIRWQAASAISKLSLDNLWTVPDLDEAAKAAVESISANSKTTKKALEVFASQLKAVAKPRVRVVFERTAKAISEAWAAEDQEIIIAQGMGDKADTPIRNFVSRKFELLLRACREIQENKTGLVLECVDDVVAWAIENTNEHERAEKRLKAIIKTITDMNVEYHLDDLKLAADYLSGVKADKLVAAKQALEGERADIAKEHRALNTPVSTVNTSVSTPAPVSTSVPTPERPLAPLPASVTARVAAALATPDVIEASTQASEDEETLEGAFDPGTLDEAAPEDFVDAALNNAPAQQLAA